MSNLIKTLHLTLSKKPFEVMLSGEKQIEIRNPSDWIKSRLKKKDYDVVKFVNGYGSDRPYFITEYKGYYISEEFKDVNYSNGLMVTISEGDYIIKLGDIIERGNIDE